MSRVHIKTNLDNLLLIHRAERAVDVKLAHVSFDIELTQVALNIYVYVITVGMHLASHLCKTCILETKSKTLAF